MERKTRTSFYPFMTKLKRGSKTCYNNNKNTVDLIQSVYNCNQRNKWRLQFTRNQTGLTKKNSTETQLSGHAPSSGPEIKNESQRWRAGEDQIRRGVLRGVGQHTTKSSCGWLVVGHCATSRLFEDWETGISSQAMSYALDQGLEIVAVM